MCWSNYSENRKWRTVYPYLDQTKENGGDTNGLIEIPAGKVREYEGLYSALRREVWEETGLNITKICGESNVISTEVGSITTISYEPFCVTQNLSGGYSIILNTFLCEAEGELLSKTDETENIHWEKVTVVETLLKEEPEKIFFMHRNALMKYMDSIDVK